MVTAVLSRVKLWHCQLLPMAEKHVTSVYFSEHMWSLRLLHRTDRHMRMEKHQAPSTDRHHRQTDTTVLVSARDVAHTCALVVCVGERIPDISFTDSQDGK